MGAAMTRRPSDKTLDACQIHQAVLSECLDDLVKQQVFSKDDVLKRLGYGGIEAAVYWDYIRRKIEHGGMSAHDAKEMELLPVSSMFFRRRRKKGMSLNSLLAGPGGKAAGFALATINDGQIALATVTVWRNRKNGMVDAARKRGDLLASALDDVDGKVADRIRGTVGLPPTIEQDAEADE